jgi:hypothetical protein
VPLVDALPQADAQSDELSPPGLPTSDPPDLVTVFECGDPGRMAIAKSLLQSAQIPFLASNEAVQDFVGWGRFPSGTNVVLGPCRLHVDRADAEAAHDLLKDLATDVPGLWPRLRNLRWHS